MSEVIQPSNSDDHLSRSPLPPMSGAKRFWIGGMGSLLPLLVTLLALDIGSIVDHPEKLTLGIYVGAAIRYVTLFVLGGIIAALNSDETKPIKLIQLGIAAPAVISSFVNAQSTAFVIAQDPGATKSEIVKPVTEPSKHGMFFDFVSSASAFEFPKFDNGHSSYVVQSDFFSEVVRGATLNLGAAAHQPSRGPGSTIEKRPPDSEPPSDKNIRNDERDKGSTNRPR
jgi:hypothetical protein